jgi:LPS O-antigen subunit length determinant protein (WzzB/FepE family)
MEPGQNSHNSQLAYDDEIDLFQLCADLWRKRVLITLVALAVLACGVSYAYLAPQVYKATSHLLPPPASSLSELTAVEDLIGDDKVSPGRAFDLTNQHLASDDKVSPGGAFDLTNQYLASMEVKKALLNSPTIAGYIDDAFPEATELGKLTSLSKLMVVLLPDIKKSRNSTEVSIEWHDPAQAAELVNTWVGLAMNGARRELITNARVSLDDETEKMSEKVKAKEALALSQLTIELLKLADAKKIAVQNGLVDPVDLATESFVTNRPFFTNVMELRSLYLLGSKALSSEIEILEKRQEDFDRYDPALTELKEHRMSLERVVLEEGLVLTANIDTRAVPPEARLKPKRTMIMLVSLVLGAMVGFFVALIVVSVEKRKAALS